MATSNGPFRQLRSIRVLLVLALLVVFLGGTVYGVMSDMSVRGLTVKVFYVSRYCTVNPVTLAKTVTFYVVASVWSASSLRTSISQVKFRLSADGAFVGSLGETDSSWDPGKGTTYQLTFMNPALDPSSLPATSTLLLALTTSVNAGIASSLVTTSNTSVQTFGTAC